MIFGQNQLVPARSPSTVVWWPNVIIVKYVRFCEERIKNRKKQKNISDKNRKKRCKIILSKKLFENRYLKREKGKKKRGYINQGKIVIK